MDNPALQQRGGLMQVTEYSGVAHAVRGIVANAGTTAGEAGQAYADAGVLAWIDYDGDPNGLEFLEYEDVTGTRLHRRVMRGERLGSVWTTCKLYCVAEATVLPAAAGSFSARDFSPRDFATG